MNQLQDLEKNNDLILCHTSLLALHPNEEFSIIDVGANVGEVSIAFSRLFPKAHIFAVEADQKTHQALTKKTEGIATIHPVNLAIHSQSGVVDFLCNNDSLLSSIIDLPDAKATTTPVKIKTETLDSFIAANQIYNVVLLKVDTEGNDLEVLKGADKLLKSPQLAYIICEFGIHPEDKRHIQINEMLHFMARNGFYISLLGGFGCFADYIYGNALFVREGIHKRKQCSSKTNGEA